MKGENKPERRLIQEKIAKMLRDGMLEASDFKDGEPLLNVKEKALKEKLEADISKGDMNKKQIIAVLIDRFLKSDSNYGEIREIEGDIEVIYGIVRRYVFQKRLDIYALRLEGRILLSRTNFEFENIHEAVRKYSTLIVKSGMIELWDDEEGNILHLFITPLRKHFPISYNNKKNKNEMMESLFTKFQNS